MSIAELPKTTRVVAIGLGESLFSVQPLRGNTYQKAYFRQEDRRANGALFGLIGVELRDAFWDLLGYLYRLLSGETRSGTTRLTLST